MVYYPIREFNLQLRGHIQRRYGADFSSSSTLCNRPYRLLVLFSVITLLQLITSLMHSVQATKKPLYFRGSGFIARSPHLAECSAGIGTFPATLQEGCRAS